MDIRRRRESRNKDQIGEAKILEACNLPMPRSQNNKRYKPMYWWTEEIKCIRNECKAARRIYTRVKQKKGKLNATEIERLLIVIVRKKN